MDKKKIFKIVIGIILFILILYLIYGFRNYMILKDIVAKVEKNDKSNNYSYSAKYIDSGKNDGKITATYYKDGIVVTKENNKVISRHDTNSGEYIQINYDNNTARVRKVDFSYGGMPSLWGRSTSIITALKTPISTEEINGIECYVIGTFHVNKENGTLIRKYFDDEYNEYSNWEFGKVTDKDIEKPNLDGFQIEEVD